MTSWSHLKVGVVHSFKGGTGKTTLALNAAKLLADLGYRVLLIETDVEMPCFFSLLPRDADESPPHFWNDVMDPFSGIGLKKAIVKHNSNFWLIYANKPVDDNGSFTYPVFADQQFYRQSLLKLQRELAQLDRNKEFDFIIMDASPGVSYGTVNLLVLASAVCLVLRPVLHDVLGARDLFNHMYKLYLHQKKVSVVWNQVPQSKLVKEHYIKQWTQLFQNVSWSTPTTSSSHHMGESNPSWLKTFEVPYSEEIAELHARGEIFFPANSSPYQAITDIVKFLKDS